MARRHVIITGHDEATGGFRSCSREQRRAFGIETYNRASLARRSCVCTTLEVLLVPNPDPRFLVAPQSRRIDRHYAIDSTCGPILVHGGREDIYRTKLVGRVLVLRRLSPRRPAAHCFLQCGSPGSSLLADLS